MANFATCDKNDFSWQTYFKAISAEEQNISLVGTGQYALRIVEKTADRTDKVIDCENHASLFELFKQALHIADDGLPALRVVITDRANGAALGTVPSCGDEEDVELIARRMFIYTTDGEVALNLANIT